MTTTLGARRDFRVADLSLDDLEMFLDLAFGLRHRRAIPAFGRHEALREDDRHGWTRKLQVAEPQVHVDERARASAGISDGTGCDASR